MKIKLEFLQRGGDEARSTQWKCAQPPRARAEFLLCISLRVETIWMLIPNFLIVFFLDCNSKLTDEWRIRTSLAYIYNDHGRIQTGAITNTPGIIFALGTNEIRTLSEIYDKKSKLSKKPTEMFSSSLTAFTGTQGEINIMSRENQIDGLVRLLVSSSTKIHAHLRSS